jgi:serine/threonine protein kinase
VRGEPITLASDVYALGVLLYRLLSGQAPYSVESRRPAEIEQLICLTQPVRPSQRVGDTSSGAKALGVSGDRLQRTLRGELDNIVLMALRLRGVGPTKRPNAGGRGSR